jgi:hypothetical protein
MDALLEDYLYADELSRRESRVYSWIAHTCNYTLGDLDDADLEPCVPRGDSPLLGLPTPTDTVFSFDPDASFATASDDTAPLPSPRALGRASCPNLARAAERDARRREDDARDSAWGAVAQQQQQQQHRRRAASSTKACGPTTSFGPLCASIVSTATPVPYLSPDR